MALGGALGSGLGAPWSRVTPRHCAWQAWHLVTSTFVSRGRRGTISHPQAFCVAGVALMALGGALGCGLGAPWSRVTPRHCAWQAWHLVTSTFVSRGRRGTISHPQAFCVAGVAQSHIHHRFAWQAWHNLTSFIVLCGRRGTHGTGWRAWVCHTHTTTYIHTYVRTYIHIYIHTYIDTYIHTYRFTFSIFHRLLCLSILPRPRYNLWSSLLEEVDLWGYPVLYLLHNVIRGTSSCEILCYAAGFNTTCPGHSSPPNHRRWRNPGQTGQEISDQNMLVG